MSAIQSMSKQTQIQIEFIRLFLFIYCILLDIKQSTSRIPSYTQSCREKRSLHSFSPLASGVLDVQAFVTVTEMHSTAQQQIIISLNNGNFTQQQ